MGQKPAVTSSQPFTLTQAVRTPITYQEKGTENKYLLNTEVMKKAEVGLRSCTLKKGCAAPINMEKDDILLFNSEWVDNHKSYLIVARQYLIPVE